MKSSSVKLIILLLAMAFGVNLIIVLWCPKVYVSLGLATSNILNDNDVWAFRGQIGDVLAGHFTAISMLFVLWGLLQQQESIKQMNTSIEKQTEALTNQQEEIRLQNESLQAQVSEMQAQKEEMKQQKIEFERSNILATYERYFNRLSHLINAFEFDIVQSTTFHRQGLAALWKYKDTLEIYKVSDTVQEDLGKILAYLNYIYMNIQQIEKQHEKTKAILMSDLQQYLRQINFSETASIFALLFINKHPKSRYSLQEIVGAFSLAGASKEHQMELESIIRKLIENQRDDIHWKKPFLSDFSKAGIVKFLYPELVKLYDKTI
ncbi:FlxA-like family protein [Sulfurimonas diazotrophicus]|uniref:FlxA-like family protein n=1 Tax=Sulfurimonas diazotrophicus TaxID=3131939 RepID=A0ABZ3HAH7_9BACT